MNSKTKLYDSLKPRVISLRLEGMTFSEIQSEVGFIPKSTLSTWLRNVELNETQLGRINEIKRLAGHAGRQKGAIANRQKRIDRLSDIAMRARKEYLENTKDPNFLAGLVLYLAEGTKKSEAFAFMNSDIQLVRFMISWIEQFGGVGGYNNVRFRLYIHELYAHEKCEEFWTSGLNAQKEDFLKTIYKPTGREYKKNPQYKGCLRVEVRGRELYWKTMTWRDCFYSNLS